MKRALGYIIFGVLALVAVYLSVTRISPFIEAEEGGSGVADAVSPTTMPSPTAMPSPTLVPSPTAIPPTAVIAPTLITPTIMPSPTVVPPTETLVPTSTPEVLAVIETLPTATLPVESTATTEMLPTEEIASTEAPTAESIVATAVVPTDMPPTAVVTDIMEVIPTVERRSDGVEVSADMTGGQLSVSTPVMPPQQPTFVPTIAIPTVEPTIVPVEMQPTADLTPATVPIVEPTTAPPEVQPTLAEAMTPAMDPTVEPSPVLALAQITGTISTPQAATLVLTLPDGTSVSATTAADGTFAFANLAAGDYRLEAQAEGFLSSQIEFTLTDGEALTLPPAVLRAGDTNRDNIIDVSDAVLIAANFGGPAISPEADLNRDGMIDIRDLTILGAVFGQSGPTSWE